MDRTYYEILGVARDAEPEQIKRRFRQLAREHHPDVAKDKTTSHQAFVRISEAYRVLIDPPRRADYDLTLRDRERRPPTPPPGPRSHATPRAGTPPPRGPGRTPGGTSGGGSRPPGAARPHASRVEIPHLLRRAQAACAGMRYRDAIQDLRMVLQADSRNAAAYALLGDIYARQGKTDDAIRAYSYAIQFSSGNAAPLEAKLNRLLSRERAQTSSARATRASGVRTRRSGRAATPMTRRQVNQRMFMGAFGFAIALFLMLIVDHTPGEPFANLPLISQWTAPLVWLMVIDGLLVGATLSLANMVRPIDEELLLPAVARGGGGVPVGLLLTLMGGLFFYMGVVMYTLIGLLQESFSSSVLIVFVATFALVVSFALLAPDRAGGQVMLFGGNVIFLSMLAGWLLGDLFRPLWT